MPTTRTGQDSQDAADLSAPRLGRKRDHTRDPEILQATLDVLAETGYESMTIDLVATRAKAGKATLYRRWPTKGHLVLAAIACLDHSDLDPGRLPDTGTLRTDLLAMIDPGWLGTGEQRAKILTGLTSMLASSPELAETVNASIVEPSAAAYRHLIQRAADRGEIPPAVNIDTLAQVIPSMAAYRAIFMKQPADRAYLTSIIDGVLLPALGLSQQPR